MTDFWDKKEFRKRHDAIVEAMKPKLLPKPGPDHVCKFRKVMHPGQVYFGKWECHGCGATQWEDD